MNHLKQSALEKNHEECPVGNHYHRKDSGDGASLCSVSSTEKPSMIQTPTVIWGFSLFGERRKIAELKSGEFPVTNIPILWLYSGSPEGCPVEKNWYVLDSRIHVWCYCISLHFCSAQSWSSSLIWVWVEGCGLLLPSLTRMYSLNWDESAPPPHEHVIRKPLLCKCSRTCSCKHKAKINDTHRPFGADVFNLACT